MPSCPGCSYPISPSQILCGRCIREDLSVRWPLCQTCYRYDACGESGYQICSFCWNTHRMFLHNSAIPIQTTIRVFLAQKLLQKHKAARCIQALWRGYKTRLDLIYSPKYGLCACCNDEPATMFNEYTEIGPVCADCFWDLREESHRAWRIRA